MKSAVAMPKKERQRENLVLVRRGDLMTPIRRTGSCLLQRVKHLGAMGFKPLNHLADVPNSRYLWKSLLLHLGQTGCVCPIMYHHEESNKNIRCYRFASGLNLPRILEEMGANQAEGEWIREVLEGKCSGQHSMDEYMVPLSD